MAQKTPTIQHFFGSIVFSGVGVALAFAYALLNHASISEAAIDVGVVCLLAILEVSISFDNAIVNATWLNKMTPLWQHRFLTWGIAIAVFGMRVFLPILLVSAFGGLSPLESLRLALTEPIAYGRLITAIHHQILSFGGTFLLLVGLRFFLNPDKKENWIGIVERPLHFCAKIPGFAIACVLILIGMISRFANPAEMNSILLTSIAGIILFIFSDGLLEFVHAPKNEGHSLSTRELGRRSFIIFLYLEVLDACFSLDGVVGAFALSKNLILIALGLGIGAFYVRSFTLHLVHTKTLQALPFLEHGAFYAILCLGSLMLLSLLLPVPEYVSGLASAAIIAGSFFHSLSDLKKNRRESWKSPG